jgi:hypothetical protein
MSNSAAATSNAVRVGSAATTESTTVAAGSPTRLPSRGAETTFAGAGVFFSTCAAGGEARCVFGGRETLATAARAAGEPELAVGRDVVSPEVGVLAAAGGDARTGAGTAFAVTCEDVLARGLDETVAATGASGVGASGCDRVVEEDLPAGDCVRVVRGDADEATDASAICGVASLRAPTGGLSGVGPDAAKAGAESAAASSMEHAATAIPLRRSVLRRDDVPVDIGPSLFR